MRKKCPTGESFASRHKPLRFRFASVISTSGSIRSLELELKSHFRPVAKATRCSSFRRPGDLQRTKQ